MTEVLQRHPELASANASALLAPGHLVRFYDDDEVLSSAVATFLGEGLVAGETCLVIATPEHTSMIEERLAARGLDVAGARSSRQLLALDAAGTISQFLAGDGPDWARFHAYVGTAVAKSIAGSATGKVRAYGEMVDLLWRRGQEKSALILEGFWDRLREQYPLCLLCAYVMRNFLNEAQSGGFQQICDLHDHVTPATDLSSDLDLRQRQVSLLQQRALALETELLRRKEMEDALRTARAEAEAANRAKDEFLAMLGHELRNPLSPMLTALELMKLRGDGDVTHEHEVLERQTRHLVRLVDDLLDVSRVTRGVLELRRMRVDLRDALAKAIDVAAPLLETRRQHLDVQAPPRGSLVLNGDEARLAQVFANLLTNAAKYTPPGGHVSVRARRSAGQVVLEVRDDGVGIAADLLPRIFDLFVQGRQPLDRGVGGLGIGLALVRSLVTLHGGTVTAESDGAGRGSVFTVHLPAADPAEAIRAPLDGTAAIAARGRRILLVDDNDDALAMLAEILRMAGHEVRTAADGPAALEAVAGFRPEVAVLDIGLPAMDGYELARWLRARIGEPAPVLIALSGYGQESDRARSQAAGFALHLVKPLDAASLLEAIEDHFRA